MANVDDKKKDLILALKLSAQYDMSSPSVAGKVLQLIKAKNLMTSPIGEKYVARLSELSKNDSGQSFNCILCNQETAVDGMLCDACMNKYSQGKLSIKKKAKGAEYASSSAQVKTPQKNKASNNVREDNDDEASPKKRIKLWHIVLIVFVAAGLIAGAIEAFSTSDDAGEVDSVGNMSSQAGAGSVSSLDSVEAIGDFANNNVVPDQYAKAYRDSLTKYMESLGANGRFAIDIVFYNKTEDGSYSYDIIMDGGIEGNLMVKHGDDGYVDGVLLSTGKGDNMASVLFISAGLAADNTISLEALQDVLVQSIKSNVVYGNYEYACAKVEDINMFSIYSTKSVSEARSEGAYEGLDFAAKDITPSEYITEFENRLLQTATAEADGISFATLTEGYGELMLAPSDTRISIEVDYKGEYAGILNIDSLNGVVCAASYVEPKSVSDVYVGDVAYTGAKIVVNCPAIAGDDFLALSNETGNTREFGQYIFTSRDVNDGREILTIRK